MTTKLKKPQEVQQLDSSAYTLRLKTDLAALAQLPPEEGSVPFLVHLDFAFANEPQILFVAGINNEWRKFAKAASWLKGPLLKQTWLGACRLEGEVMQLVVRKGKILEKQFLAAIKHNSALKKLTWQIVEDPTEGEELEEEQEDSRPQQPTANEDHRKQAQEINVQLVKLLPQIKDSVGPARQALLQEIEAWANRLYAIPNWEAYTDDKIERYLQQVEAFLAKQEQEQGPDPAAMAGQYTKELLALVQRFKGAEGVEKGQIRVQMQALAERFQALPNWQQYTDDRIEKLLAQIQGGSSDADEAFIVEHKAKVNGMHTAQAVKEHSQAIAGLAQTPKQKAFVETLSQYAAHLQEVEAFVLDNLAAQDELKAVLNNPQSDAPSKEQAKEYLEQLEQALAKFLG